MKLIRNKMALTPYENRTVILVNSETQKSLAFDKILEEAHELFNAKSPEEIVAELGDLEDSIIFFKKLYNIDENILAKSKADKAELKGTFDGGYVLL